MKNSANTILDFVYARIDILDVVDNKFVHAAYAYLLGDASKYVKSVADINLRNKSLVDEIGANAVRELTKQEPIIGGDDWEALDEMDIEDLLNTDTVIDVPNKTKKQSAILKGDVISDMVFYSRDKIDDVRNKIAIATNIKPYKQYIWVPNFGKSMDGDEISLMGHYNNSIRDVNGFPVDDHPSPTQLTGDTIHDFASSNAVTLICISLDSIIQDKNKLRFISRSDAELFELIQSNTIQRFFPMMDIHVFTQFLSNEDELETRFKEYAFDKDEMRNIYKSQMAILPMLNKQPHVTIDSSDLLTASTTSIMLGYIVPSMDISIDTHLLFKTINTTTFSNIASVDLYSFNNNKMAVRFRKIQQCDQFHKTISDASMHIRRRELLYNKSIIITFLPDPKYTDLSMVISQRGSVWIRAHPNMSYVFSKTAFIELITPIVNKIISEFNKYDYIFMSQERIPLLGSTNYQILNSSTSLTFKFSVAYSKLINVMIDKLMNTGFISVSPNEHLRAHRITTAFVIKYGVSKINNSELSEIEIRNVNESAVIDLLNLDIRETDLYIDIIGRLVLSVKSNIILEITKTSELGLVDPVLFRPRVSSDGYSRVCQKKFQPLVTTKDNKQAVEYFNFTFNKPEYYTCPKKIAPVLGFIQGRHEHGYCLPCCRKTKPINAEATRKTCIANETIDSNKSNAYRIDYPINSITNHKIMNRISSLPDYVIESLGGLDLVVNGLIMNKYDDIRDDTKEDAKSFMQTAIILGSIAKKSSYKDLIVDIVSAIKNPILNPVIMRHNIVSRRFPTPMALVHAIQDRFLKHTILSSFTKLSEAEWNDLIVFLANCSGINVLLISDDRASDIKIDNLRDIDTARPLFVIMKRLSLEWSMYHQNTRALYTPITSVTTKSANTIKPIDLSTIMTKIRRIVFGNTERVLSKQFTATRIADFVKQSKQYKLLHVIIDQKLAILSINNRRLITSIGSMTITTVPQKITEKPTASITNLTTFISDYNTMLIDRIDKSAMTQYQQYLQIAIKKGRYKLINASAFILKIQRFISHNGLIIGAIISVIDTNSVVATELMFIANISMKSGLNEIQRMCDARDATRNKGNARAVLTEPLDQEFTMEYAIEKWDNNPLQFVENSACKHDIKSALNTGLYMNNIYTMLAIAVVAEWGTKRATDLEEYIIKSLEKIGSLPIQDTSIDVIIEDAKFPLYDKNILRQTIETLFKSINSFDRSIPKAIDRVKKFKALDGFEIRNIHIWMRKDIETHVSDIIKKITIKVNEYPVFDIKLSATDQRALFYKNKKLCLYKDIYDDMISFLSADLSNPFRRDYIIGLQLTMSSLEDIFLHIGELIYVQNISK